jgi:hypothetical protein
MSGMTPPATLEYCIYVHRTEDTGAIFYVGKAKRERRKNAFCRPYSRKSRNKFWESVARKHGWRAEIVSFFETMPEADAEERRLIALYGKRTSGGILCNLADGGEGNAGVLRTPEWRSKVRIAHLGKKLTQEHRQKLSKARMGKSLSCKHKEAIGVAASRLKNFRLNDPEVRAVRLAALRSPETRAKLSSAAKRLINFRLNDPDVRAKNLAVRSSPETRKKMSISAKNRRICSLKN